jgi:hypothetical protein
MKRIVLLTCIGSLALTLTALGATKEKHPTRSAKPRSTQPAHSVSSARSSHVGAVRAPRTITRQVRPQSVSHANSLRSNRLQPAKTRTVRTADRLTRTNARSSAAVERKRAVAKANSARTSRVNAGRTQTERNVVRANNVERDRTTERPRIRNERTAGTTRTAARNNLAVNRQRNLTFAHNVLANRDKNVRITNYWGTGRFRGPKYVAFHNYRRVWHDRAWWQRHYTRIVFVLGGWWYWDAGYWYPAWGYDPYVWYPYDGPIYTGYGYLTPDQVIVNVQVALRDQGYYAGPIDGLLGPETRAALAAYQADQGLAITSAIDSPTLATLGLA